MSWEFVTLVLGLAFAFVLALRFLIPLVVSPKSDKVKALEAAQKALDEDQKKLNTQMERILSGIPARMRTF